MKQLCSEIRTRHVESYLLADGWRIVDDEGQDAMFFEKPGDEEKPWRVWIWRSPEKPKFASQIHNLLFALAVIESREPLDVGNTIINSDEPATGAPAGEARTRLAIRNTQSERVQCQIRDSEPRFHLLEPDDVLELVFRGPLSADPEVALTREGIHVSCPSGCHVEVYQGTSSAAEGRTVMQHVHDEVQQAGLDESQLQGLIKDMESVLTRASFELDAEGEINAGRQVAAQRQAAIVATALAPCLPGIDSSEQVVWRVTARIIAMGGLRLMLDPSHVTQLFRIAISDNALAPTATAEWLKEFSHDLTLR